MRNTTSELERYLNDLAVNASAGDRLPTIRELMRRFGLSQMSVQRVFHDLRTRGLVDSQVGRGTFFLASGTTGSEAPTLQTSSIRRTTAKSILLLRRSISVSRGRTLVEKLHQRFIVAGHKVLEVSYSDPSHARAVLKGLPRFDACVVQSTYRPIPVEVLAAIRDRTDIIAVDGAALFGADVEAVGTEWGEPLAEAALRLRQNGHRRLAFAATHQPLLSTQLGFRRCEHLPNLLPDISVQALKVAALPDEDYVQNLVSELMVRLDNNGRLPFTGLIAWGIEDGIRFRRMLLDVGISIPNDLSVILLGRTDLHSEHGGFFETIGSSIESQVETLYQAISRHWTEPGTPCGIHFTPVTRLAGASVGAPVDIRLA